MIPQAIEVLRCFVELQFQLVEKFSEHFLDDARSSNILDMPKQGAVELGANRWVFSRHGLGIMFVDSKARIVVDVHTCFFEEPRAFDACRVYQYCESKCLLQLAINAQLFVVSSELEVESVLVALLSQGFIRKVDSHFHLYRLAN